jgi:serine/threonine protein kinase
VLTDFGIAQSAGASAMTTAIGVLIGSPSYMAPERARGGRSGAPGDLWGLGATLYAAVEGHGPFDREGGALASLTAVVADELAPATHAGPLWPVINGLLRKNPDERLDAATAERLLRGISSTYVARTPRPRRSRGPVVALVGPAALAVIAVSGAAVGLTLASSSPRPRTISAAASARAPTAAPHPSTIASAPPKTSTTTHLTAHTSRARPARSSAPRLTSATARSRTRKAGNATARSGWLAIRVGTFIFRIPNPEWRFHPIRGPRSATWGRARRHA